MPPFAQNPQPWTGQGFQPLPPMPAQPMPPSHAQPLTPHPGPSGPHGFTVSGPSGYHGWGWSAEMGGNSSYLRYQDNAGGGFSLWRNGSHFRFQ